MDTDGSQQAALHARVVDLLTAPVTSKMMIVGEMTDVGKQRHPHSADFNNLWDDLVANAHHRIECVPCPDNISCVCVCVYVSVVVVIGFALLATSRCQGVGHSMTLALKT